ncbi:MAG TPA: YetF domain-containing protein [Burkholderiaceae bacterium]|nr:YetF domain-containing protein [Burkholderiaceae bacterium]
MFSFSTPPLELLVRGSAMYWFIFVLLRVAGRRNIGSLGVADLLVVVLIADAAQNGMSGDYMSILDGMILVAVIVGWTVFVDRSTYHLPVLARLLSIDHICLVKDGRIIRHNMQREAITMEDLTAELRESGLDDIAQVRRAYIEADGNISILPYRSRQEQPSQPQRPP